MLLQHLKEYKRVVLGGDDNQLPPYVSRDLDDPPSMMTWLRRLTGNYQIPVTLLTKQYRMMPSVGSLVSDLFYKGELLHHKTFDGRRHLFFHDMKGRMCEKSTSRSCVQDSRRCIEIWRKYRKNYPQWTIQVLTFYEAQRAHVKRLNNKINVCCVDSFQGQEAHLVILLLSVRKCKLSKFMLHRGRLCVALSRVKGDLHIV